MRTGNSTAQMQYNLDTAMPSMADAKLGTLLFTLITDHNALLAACQAANVAGTSSLKPLPLPGQ